MATSTPLISAPVLSHKQRRAAQRKERRKRKRQALAQARECGLKNGTNETPEEEINDEDDDEVDDIAEQERLRLHEEWLQRERLAQEEFRLKYEREEAARRRKEEEERMIKEEWEAQQKREQEEKEQKLQEKRGREEAVQKMLDEAENQLENGGPWMNPEAPVAENSENFGTERDVANCPFFLKTGACRFGDRCSRKHVYPTTSPTMMIRGMFTTFGMEEARRDDYDTDAWLEHSEEELQESFLDFYHDVLPELKSIGKVVQFKVSCNYEPHLRGNVYVQFDTEEQCKEALIKFHGRWYAGRQLHCETCPVTRWKNAICGLFDRQKCPKGKHCNFLHVFRNPGNEFWEADRDLRMSSDRRGSRRDGWNSERHGDRSWRQSHYSRSPPRSERSHSRRESDRRRSRSRERSQERRASQQHREDKWSTRSRHSDRRNSLYASRRRDRSRSRSRERSRSRSRERSRNRSRDREQDRQRNRSSDRDREHKHRNRSEERDKDRGTHGKSRERSRSSSTEGERNKQIREKSPKKPDKNEETPDDDTNKRRRHKHSKKSKKKSKKKHKKKSHLLEETSSGESEKERESKEEKVETLAASSPSLEENETALIQRNDDLDESPRGDTEMNFIPEVKSEQTNSEIPSEPSGKE